MKYPDEAIVFEAIVFERHGEIVEFWDWDSIPRWILVVPATTRPEIWPRYAVKYQLKPLTPAAQAVWEVM